MFKCSTRDNFIQRKTVRLWCSQVTRKEILIRRENDRGALGNLCFVFRFFSNKLYFPQTFNSIFQKSVTGIRKHRPRPFSRRPDAEFESVYRIRVASLRIDTTGRRKTGSFIADSQSVSNRRGIIIDTDRFQGVRYRQSSKCMRACRASVCVVNDD